VKPNAWNVFRRAHRAEGHTRRTLSSLYRRARDEDWCAMARKHGLDRCVALDAVVPHHVRPARNPCPELRRLTADDATRRRQWAQVHRTLRRYRFPAAVVDYGEAHLRRIEDVVGEMFFGREFVPALRSAGWKVSHEVGEPRYTGREGAAATTCYLPTAVHRANKRNPAHPVPCAWRTVLTSKLLDHFCPDNSGNWVQVTNDEFEVCTRLEWVAHVIGHELVHCLHLGICGEEAPLTDRAGHNEHWTRLNRVILGGIGHAWKPVNPPYRRGERPP
jgi:hypothetical protein